MRRLGKAPRTQSLVHTVAHSATLAPQRVWCGAAPRNRSVSALVQPPLVPPQVVVRAMVKPRASGGGFSTRGGRGGEGSGGGEGLGGGLGGGEGTHSSASGPRQKPQTRHSQCF